MNNFQPLWVRLLSDLSRTLHIPAVISESNEGIVPSLITFTYVANRQKMIAQVDTKVGVFAVFEYSVVNTEFVETMDQLTARTGGQLQYERSVQQGLEKLTSNTIRIETILKAIIGGNSFQGGPLNKLNEMELKQIMDRVNSIPPVPAPEISNFPLFCDQIVTHWKNSLATAHERMEEEKKKLQEKVEHIEEELLKTEGIIAMIVEYGGTKESTND